MDTLIQPNIVEYNFLVHIKSYQAIC